MYISSSSDIDSVIFIALTMYTVIYNLHPQLYIYIYTSVKWGKVYCAGKLNISVVACYP